MITIEQLEVLKDIQDNIETLDEGEWFYLALTPEKTRALYLALVSAIDVFEDVVSEEAK